MDDEPFEVQDDKIITRKSFVFILVLLIVIPIIFLVLLFAIYVHSFVHPLIIQPNINYAKSKENYILFTEKLGSDYKLNSYIPSSSFGQRVPGARLEMSIAKEKTDKDINQDIIKALRASGCRKADYVYGKSGQNGTSDYSEKKKEFFMLIPTNDHMSCAIDSIYADGGVEIHAMYTNVDLSDATVADNQYTDGYGNSIRRKAIPDEAHYSKLKIDFVGF